MTKIDLRRGDFEGMHPKAKLFGFDEDKKLYTGDGVESINHQWTTWCACIGMLHLEVKEAQAVPEGFVLVDKHQLAQLMANMDSFGKKALGDDYVSFADIAAVLDEAQEPTND